MLQVQVLSDIHTEFHRDGGISFVNSLDPSGVDVLVLSGDITIGRNLPSVLSLFCEKYPDSAVLYLPGNHEFYGHSLQEVMELMQEADESLSNLHVLYNKSVEIDGIKFVGSPLWFPMRAGNDKKEGRMNDFNLIRDFRSWVYKHNEQSLEFLEKEVTEGCVVATHYLPSEMSISPRFKGNDLNVFFVCTEAEAIITDKKPQLWIHGHTHDSADYVIGKTRVVCNPFGYAGRETNTKFQDKLLVEVK